MNIAIIHYRAGKTDGVSLEISKRKSILEKLGHSVKVISGPVSIGSDYEIPELEFDIPEVQQIKGNCFAFFGKKEFEEKELLQRLWKMSRIIENRFYFIQNKEKFDLLLAHNIFSHGRHIAAASAFAAIIENLQIPCLATNHDYYWERDEYTQTCYSSITDYLNEYVPFKSKLIRYISINSIAVEECKRKTGIHSDFLGDIFDFEQPQWEEDEFNRSLKEDLGINDNDLVILQATRIVPRKAIESAVAFTKKLTLLKNKLINRNIYNGKVINSNSRIILLLAGYAEDSSLNYLDKIKQISRNRINAVFASDLIDAERLEEDNKKIYSLWDTYAISDIVTFPSLSEGWGNQFIEAVFARRPIVVFEYPVFKKDIKKEGYSYISLGDKIDRFDKNGLALLPKKTINDATGKALSVLLSDDTSPRLEENFRIGKKHHGFQVMEKYLKEYLREFGK